jgi:hypothetical protein
MHSNKTASLDGVSPWRTIASFSLSNAFTTLTDVSTSEQRPIVTLVRRPVTRTGPLVGVRGVRVKLRGPFTTVIQASVARLKVLVSPREALVTPSEALVTPSEALVTPSEALVTPSEALVTPSEALVTPSEARARLAGALGSLNGIPELRSGRARPGGEQPAPPGLL